MALNKLNSLSSLNTLNTLGGGSGGAQDLTVDELLSIANASGGALSQRAMELAHPERSILSTVGKGFKNLFKGFIDTISLPGEIVAGIISPNYTIGEAIDQNKRVSDAIFGDKSVFGGDEPTTLQKIGNFIVRLPVDILTDPLTYLTFGGQAGILGLKSLAKIDLGLGSIEKLGLAAKAAKQGGQASAYLTKPGSELVGYLRNFQRKLVKQAEGDIPLEKFNKSLSKTLAQQREEILGKGILKEAEIDLAENELKQLLKLTTESSLDIDWAKRAVSNLLEKAPALLQTILDKGGIKFLGKTILSGQRIGSVARMIPLMSKLDDVTLPLRQSLHAKFDPALTPIEGGGYMRLPDEAIQFETQMRNLEQRMSVDTIDEFKNIQKELNLSVPEWNSVYDALHNSKPIADPRLYKAYLLGKGINDKNAKIIEGISGSFGDLSNHIGTMFVRNNTQHFSSGKYAKELGHAQTATIARYVKQNSENFRAQLPKIKNIVGIPEETAVARGVGEAVGDLDPLAQEARKYKTAEEFVNKYVGDWRRNPEIQKLVMGEPKVVKISSLDPTETAKTKELFNYGRGDTKITKGRNIETPILISEKGTVFDGHTRIKQAIANGDKTIKAYITPGDGLYDKTKSQLTDFYNKAVGGATKEAPQLTPFQKAISEAKSVQEAGWVVGKEVAKISDQMIANGKTMDEVLGDKRVKELFKMREEIGGLTQDAERTGTMEDAFLQAKEEDGIWTITDDSGATYKRAQAHAKELRLAGYDNVDINLMTIMAQQTLKNQRQMIGQHFMEGLVTMFAKQADEAPESWRKINHASLDAVAERIRMPLQTKDGIDFVFNPAVAKHFEDMVSTLGKDAESSKFWKSFDDLQRYWKTSVTSIFPMFHGRNAISGVLQNYLDLGFQTFNPKTNVMAMDIAWKDMQANTLARKMKGAGKEAADALTEYNTLMEKVIFTDKTGFIWRFEELRDVIKNNGVALNKNIIGAMDVTMDRDKMLSSVFGVGKTKPGKVKESLSPFNLETNLATKLGRNVAYTIENQLRLTNFIANLNGTGDVMHAAGRSKLFQFDYGNLTKFEKDVMRRLIPFYTFTRKNLELQARILMSNPGRISHELTTIRGVGDILGGEQLTDEEKKLLPTWMANTIAFKRKGKDGKDEIISGFGTPIEQPFQVLQPTSLLGSVSPLFRYPVEAMTGYQFFRGKPTSEVTNAQNFDQATDAIKAFIGYGKYEGIAKDGTKYSISYSLRPGNMHLINNLPFIGRVTNVLGQMTNASVSEQLKLLQGITGVNVRAYNFDQLQLSQEEKLEASIEKIMKDAGVGGVFKRFYLKKNTQQVQ